MTVAAKTFPKLADVVDEISAVIERSKRIGCLAHKDADADSLGSALGFALALREMGKEVHIIVPSPKPKLLDYLPGFSELEFGPPPAIDSLFTFDCASVQRFGDKEQLVETMGTVVNVDHHMSNEGFGSIQLIDAKASATGQVVFALLQALKAPITPAAATNLYAALFTDTGGFRHENTTEEALRMGADLVKLGADPYYVALKSYKSRSVAQVRLEGLAIGKMSSESNGQLLYSVITQAMLRETGADMQEAEGVIDQLQSIGTMKIAIIFKETELHSTKISVRTRDEFDALHICKPFGGGGHYRAAGAELNDTLAAAQAKVLAVARELLLASSI